MGCLLSLLLTVSSAQTTCADELVRDNPHASGLNHYAILESQFRKPTLDINTFRSKTGIEVTHRDEAGRPIAGTISVLSDNSGNQIAILADFNAWGKEMAPEDHLKPVPGTPYYEGHVRRLFDGMEYRLLLNGEPVLDPSSIQFTTPEMFERFRPGETPYLNSVFSDVEAISHRPATPIDFRGRSVLIGESGVYELAAKWNHKGQIGPPRVADTYRFVAESGLTAAISGRGYTHLELLPFTSSVDGHRWQNRYQSFGLFGPDSRYGTPAEFRSMIAAFSVVGVGALMDGVLGHYPFRANHGIRALEPIGIHRFVNGFGKPLFGGKLTPWGTYRWDFENPFVRRFLIDSVISMFRAYGLSGIRIDNVDGIRQEPGGALFLRELNSTLRSYVPQALILGEMFDDQAPALTTVDNGGLGFHAANDVDFFYSFVQRFLQGWDHEIHLQRVEWYLNDSWQWGRVPMERWITNHDEAANRQPGASGEYVATLLKGGTWEQIESKTKAWGTLGMLLGSVYLDMPQMRLLQEGSFNNNAAIDWDLLRLGSQASTDAYFTQVSLVFRDGAEFAPKNLHPHISNHVDEDNKVISLLRIDYKTGRKTYAIINLSSRTFHNYRFGVDASRGKAFSVLLNSDDSQWGGGGTLKIGSDLFAHATSLHGKLNALELPELAPRSAIIVREQP